MLLTTKPATVLTHEQNILWSFSELRRMLNGQPVNDTAPRRVVETEGYYASDVLSVAEIGAHVEPRHALRILIPVKPGFYGASQAVWEFAGTIALGLDTAIGLNGVQTPTAKIRFNPDRSDGTLQRWLPDATGEGGSWGSDLSSFISEAYLVPTATLTPSVVTKLDAQYGTYHQTTIADWSFSISGSTITAAAFATLIATPGTVKL
jgi:hypothetical protein